VKISKAAKYALTALAYIAGHKEGEYVRIEAIADRYDISLNYLYNILGHLVRIGILKSNHGAGGYSLAKNADRITLRYVIEAIDGSAFETINLVEQTRSQRFAVRMKKVVSVAAAEHKKILQGATLAAITEDTKENETVADPKDRRSRYPAGVLSSSSRVLGISQVRPS
jgi:Rrf2 family protein